MLPAKHRFLFDNGKRFFNVAYSVENGENDPVGMLKTQPLFPLLSLQNLNFLLVRQNLNQQLLLRLKQVENKTEQKSKQGKYKTS
jgi:hypothetical protein